MGKSLVEWANLYQQYLGLNARLEVIEPSENCPEMTFPGDLILLHGSIGIASRLWHRGRQKEVRAIEKWAVQKKFKLYHPGKKLILEGNADTIFWNGLFLMGYGVRTTRESANFIEDVMGIETVALEMRSPFFHFDICLFPLDSRTLVYSPDALSASAISSIEKLAKRTIKVSRKEALKLSCNAMVFGKSVILNGECPKLEEDLRRLGFQTITVRTSEAAKVGGGAKCHTLEQYASSPA